MKKLIVFGTMCIVACVLFSSCSSRLSIVKRHYNNGYYVERSNKRDVPFVKQERVAKAKTPFYAEQAPVVQNNKVNQIPVATNVTNNAGNTRNSFNQTSSPQKVNAPVITEIPAPQIISSVSAVNNVKDNEGRGLSLFWIVILILVIIWAFGLGFEAGWLINLLLVVALILLILWLLRIV